MQDGGQGIEIQNWNTADWEEEKWALYIYKDVLTAVQAVKKNKGLQKPSCLEVRLASR